MPEQSSNDSFKKDSSMKKDTPLLSPKTNSVFPGGDRIKIRYALQQKRIGNNDIVNALSLIDEEAYTTLLADLLEKKSRSINDEDVEVRRSKLLRFAASRGFETELVFRILKEIES